MGARHRLNTLYLIGAFVVASLIGGAAESWGVFFAAMAVLIGLYVSRGNIRPLPNRQSGRRHR